MSTVILPGDYRSSITVDDLKVILKQFKISIDRNADEETYLQLLQASEAVYAHLQQLDDYILPALELTPTTSVRSFYKPSHQENVLNAWSHRCSFRAKNTTSSKLSGRTIVFKDNISVGGLPTAFGTFPQLVSHKCTQFPVATIDASVVRRALEAGATVAGTAVCESYSASPLSVTSATGAIHSAWLKGYTAGGSSSGCGSLMGIHAFNRYIEQKSLIDQTADLAVGGDQGGSIRIPSSYNGTYGLKPTFGLVPYTGAITFYSGIDHLGPMTSTLSDLASLLQVLAGSDDIDPRQGPRTPLPENVPDYLAAISTTPATASALKVGILTEGFEIFGIREEIKQIVLESSRQFFRAAGVHCEEVSIPMHKQGPLLWTAATPATLADHCVAGYASDLVNYTPPHIKLHWPPDQEMFDLLNETNPTMNAIVFASEMLKSRFDPSLQAKANRLIFKLRQAYDAALDKYDVLIMPTTPTEAVPHPKSHDYEANGSTSRVTIEEKARLAMGQVGNTCSFNVTGHPALSIPCGVTSGVNSGGNPLPVGMQIVGRRWDEVTVLKAAALFEAGRDELHRLNVRGCSQGRL